MADQYLQQLDRVVTAAPTDLLPISDDPAGDGRLKAIGAADLIVSIFGTPVIADGLAGGQTIIGGTDAGDDLVLRSTSHATKGNVEIRESTLAIFDASGVQWGTVTQTGAADFSSVSSRGSYRAFRSAFIATDTTSIGVGRSICHYQGEWADDTDASRRGRGFHVAYDALGQRETNRQWSDGSRGYFAAACQTTEPDGAEMATSSVCLWMDGGVLKARYKDSSGVVSDLTLSKDL